jgi:hypothetical protein
MYVSASSTSMFRDMSLNLRSCHRQGCNECSKGQTPIALRAHVDLGFNSPQRRRERRELFFKIIDHSDDAVFHNGHIKIQEQSQLKA